MNFGSLRLSEEGEDGEGEAYLSRRYCRYRTRDCGTPKGEGDASGTDFYSSCRFGGCGRRRGAGGTRGDTAADLQGLPGQRTAGPALLEGRPEPRPEGRGHPGVQEADEQRHRSGDQDAGE